MAKQPSETNNETEERGDLSEAETEGIKAGLADIEVGRTHTHEHVRAEIYKKLL